MTVFSLLIYSCVTITAPMSDELIQKTCAWDHGGGSLYMTQAGCEAAAPPVGSPIFSDVADGRKVENTKCQPLSVLGSHP